MLTHPPSINVGVCLQSCWKCPTSFFTFMSGELTRWVRAGRMSGSRLRCGGGLKAWRDADLQMECNYTRWSWLRADHWAAHFCCWGLAQGSHMAAVCVCVCVVGGGLPHVFAWRLCVPVSKCVCGCVCFGYTSINLCVFACVHIPVCVCVCLCLMCVCLCLCLYCLCVNKSFWFVKNSHFNISKKHCHQCFGFCDTCDTEMASLVEVRGVTISAYNIWKTKTLEPVLMIWQLGYVYNFDPGRWSLNRGWLGSFARLL